MVMLNEYPRVRPGWLDVEPEEQRCCLCGKPAKRDDPLEEHHVFGGARRELSEHDGLVVLLHGKSCHRLGKNAVHKNRAVAEKLQAAAERAWLNYDEERTVEAFRLRYGRNYI